MLFFFELFLFVLVLLTMALGEFVSRGLALVLWLVVTAFALVGYVLVRRSLSRLAFGEPGPSPPLTERPVSAEVEPPEADRPGPSIESAQRDPLDEKWARTLLYNWRRSNTLLVLGALLVAGWYWLGR
jgi:hypothetical protein